MQIIFEKIAQDGFASADIKRNKALLRSEVIYSREGLSKLANIYGRVLVNGLPVNYVDIWADNIAAVTNDQLIAMAQYILQSDKATIGILDKIN